MSRVVVPLVMTIEERRGCLYVHLEGSVSIPLEPGAVPPVIAGLGLEPPIKAAHLPPGGVGISPESRAGRQRMVVRSQGGSLGTWLSAPTHIPSGDLWFGWEGHQSLAQPVYFLGTCEEFTAGTLIRLVKDYSKRGPECRLYMEKWGYVYE